MELKAVVGSAVRGAAATSALQVKTVRKIHSLELAKLRKTEMERQEETRKTHRESVRAEIEKRKNEREEIKKKEEEKKMEEERKLMKEMNQLSKDLKNLSKEIKKSGKAAMKKLTKLGCIEAIPPPIEAIKPTVEAILPPIEAAIVPSIEETVPTVEAPAVPSPISEGQSSLKTAMADCPMTGTSLPYQFEIEGQSTCLSLARPSLIPRLTKKRDLDLLRGKGSDSDPDRKSESGSPTGVLERTVEFGSSASFCGLSSGASAGLDSDDDDLRVGLYQFIVVEDFGST